MEQKSFETYLKNTTKAIVVFGTGHMMQYLYDACQESGIALTAFCDNNKNKWGQTLYDLPILSLDSVKEMYDEPIFLVSLWDPSPQQSVLAQLAENDCKECYTMQYCVEHMTESVTWSASIKNDLYIHKMQAYKTETSELLHVDNINVFVTEKCSLKCRDCAHFAQFFEKPVTYSKEAICTWIDRIDEVFDSVGFLCLMGGEPMMHPDIFEIVLYAQTKKSINCVIITTNGTIIPKKEDLLKVDKEHFYFTISDYGDVSKNIGAIKTLLKDTNIDSYNPIKDDTWGDSAHIEFRDKTIPQLTKTYKECHALHCVTSVDNKIFRCPFLAATYQLQAIPKNDLEFMDLSDTSRAVDELKKETIYYLYGKPYFKGCNWCVNRSGNEGGTVKPAVQTKEVLPYKKYMD